jgi:hypothetical protein
LLKTLSAKVLKQARGKLVTIPNPLNVKTHNWRWSIKDSNNQATFHSSTKSKPARARRAVCATKKAQQQTRWTSVSLLIMIEAAKSMLIFAERTGREVQLSYGGQDEAQGNDFEFEHSPAKHTNRTLTKKANLRSSDQKGKPFLIKLYNVNET